MPFEAPDKINQTPIDRKLGSEWEDWDGSDRSQNTQAPAWVFLVLVGLVFIIFNGLGLGFIWLMTPRLVEWGLSGITIWLTVILSSYLFGFYLILLFIFWGAGFLKRILKMLGGLLWLISPVVLVGKLFGLTRDRIGHAYFLVHNRVEWLPPAIKDPKRLLLLAPRCLSRESVQGLRALKTTYGFEQVVAIGGTEARKAIGQVRPKGIIAVACERDLLVGIRDVRRRIPVLGFSNLRPEGPCKNTTIDLQEIEVAIKQFLGIAMDQNVHINKEGGTVNEGNN